MSESLKPFSGATLWNRNFCLLIVANFLFYTAVYLLFPLLHQWVVQEWGYSEIQSGCMLAVFGLALFLPGAFNNYLVDAFSRKGVAIRSILLLGILTLAYPYVTAEWMIIGLRLLQGMLMGIAVMATGATLAIDVTPSNNRNAANRVFAWCSILGMLIGVLLGLEIEQWLMFQNVLYVSASLCGVAALLISWVVVCFRAPLNLPLLSFDRFLLFRTLVPGINMLSVPVILGILFVTVSDTFFYLCIGGGFLIYLLIRQIYTAPLNGRIQILIGQLCTAVGLFVWWMKSGDSPYYAGALLIGIGTGFSIGQFLKMMILLPRHCERGTGYHTYQLLWEAGIAGGVLLGMWADACRVEQVHLWALSICVAGALLYEGYVHCYFIKRIDEKE